MTDAEIAVRVRAKLAESIEQHDEICAYLADYDVYSLPSSWVCLRQELEIQIELLRDVLGEPAMIGASLDKAVQR